MVVVSMMCLIAGSALAMRVPMTPIDQALTEGLAGSLIVVGLAVMETFLPLLY